MPLTHQQCRLWWVHIRVMWFYGKCAYVRFGIEKHCFTTGFPTVHRNFAWSGPLHPYPCASFDVAIRCLCLLSVWRLLFYTEVQELGA